MKPRTIAEPLSFALALLTAIGAVALAMQFPRAPDAHSGPGSFPIFLGVILLILALCGLILSLREGCPPDSRGHPEAGPPMRSPTEPLETAKCKNRLHMLLLGSATILYLLLMPLLGFIIGTSLLCMAVLLIHGYRNPVRALAAGFVAAFALYGIFGLLMNVVLPKGWIG